MLILSTILAAVVFTAPTVDDTTLRAKLTHAIVRRKEIPYNVKHGVGERYWKACREAPEGCEVHIEIIVDYIVEASKEYSVSPYLLAAMVWQESRYNPYAQGDAGEMGVLQIHPSNRSDLRFMQRGRAGDKYRTTCKTMPGQCQIEILMHGASILASGVVECGSVEGALSRYNTGKCRSKAGANYAKRALRMTGDLRHEVEG